MAAQIHGLSVVRKNDGLPMIPDASQAVCGLLCTGDDTDASKIPLNTPVLFTNSVEALNYVGSKGTIGSAIEAMSNQTRSPVVIVRVSDSTTPATLEANLKGGVSNGQYTGMKAFLTAKSRFGIAPKIFGAPGLDRITVTASFAAIAEQVGGFLYANSNTATKEQAVTNRANFGQRELMLIHGDFLSGAKTVHSIAAAMGLRAKLDDDPSYGVGKSISNVPINGVDGMGFYTDWDYRNKNTDAQYLNEQGLSVLIKHKGFRIWGNRTTSADLEWPFETYVRTDQFLADTMADVMFSTIDAKPTGGLIKGRGLMFDAKLKDLTREEKIVGGGAWFDPSVNTAANLSAGQFFFDYDYTPFSPMEHITLTQRKTTRYWVDLVKQVAQIVPSPAI